MTDSYKITHAFQYPNNNTYGIVNKMVAYGEFRGPFNGDIQDDRIVFYGIRYIIENYLHRQWTNWDVEMADRFFCTHNAMGTKYPFPKHLFLKFIENNEGYFPVKIESLPEGTVIFPHIPVYQITAEREYAPLVTFLETILTHIWYPTTVATLSRKCKQIISDAYKTAGHDPKDFMINYKLQDFGFRGCTCVEQSIIGGTAHLLNFSGSDTMSASFYAQYVLNKGIPVAESIPATEHSVMLSFGKKEGNSDGAYLNEIDAIRNMLNTFGNGIFACVMDTYDYHNTIFKLIPMIDKEMKGSMVLRPDSGTPKEVVLDAMIAIEIILSKKNPKEFYENKKYLEFTRYSVIQGDGVDLVAIKEILDHIMDPGKRIERIKILNQGEITFEKNKLNYGKGVLINDETMEELLKYENVCYSPKNCTFGMGGGLLQKVNRDTMKFATKLNYLELTKENKKITRNVMKNPKTDISKNSLPGELAVKYIDGIITACTKSEVKKDENLLKVVYDRRPCENIFSDSFDDIRKRVDEQWSELDSKKTTESINGHHKAISDKLFKEQQKLSG